MPKNNKFYIPHTAIEISSSVQEGLPLVATKYMAVIIEGIMARAQELYPITICHYLFMQNHFHMICVVKKPEDVTQFFRYLKAETGHCINRLLGRKNRSVWVEGIADPTIISKEKVMERICYLYLNPVKAELVERVEEFPGVNSYQALRQGGMKKSCKRVNRDSVSALPQRALSLEEQEALAQSFIEGEGFTPTLEVEPWAWIECFEGVEKDEKILLKEFLKELTSQERHYASKRSTPVKGAHALRLADPRVSYQSHREGRKTPCIGLPEERRKYMSFFKEQQALARQVYQQWKKNDFSLSYPPGFFAPGGVLFAVFPSLALIL